MTMGRKNIFFRPIASGMGWETCIVNVQGSADFIPELCLDNQILFLTLFAPNVQY